VEVALRLLADPREEQLAHLFATLLGYAVDIAGPVPILGRLGPVARRLELVRQVVGFHLRPHLSRVRDF
jgi:hypothetical protein